MAQGGAGGTSTPPSIAGTPVPALPPPIALNSYPSCGPSAGQMGPMSSHRKALFYPPNKTTGSFHWPIKLRVRSWIPCSKLTQACSTIQATYPAAYSLGGGGDSRFPPPKGPTGGSAAKSSLRGQLQQKRGRSRGGLNIFIYPTCRQKGGFPSPTDSEILQMFLPFGNVIFCPPKVFVGGTEQKTQQSFVSFDNPSSAQTAIQAMNGFQIGMKRLKVQLKRPKDANRPY
ncbi:hypothetical protein CRENBAI_020889 [Crenichthys baileyi]|uniref:RRM domain-containing protein n=1 Tax=Crenichthys baileyi TaxID=28760 RepID=A0AAV9RTJ1_9TELE